jgi:FkbM family methyltransferase
MNTKWITSKLGYDYLIDADDKYMERCLMGSGYQIRNWEFAKTLCNPNGVALDIGASIGMNAVNYSTYFDSVEAFEPDPDVYNCMLETLAANNIDNVVTHPIAASNRSETNILVKFPRATFANTLKPAAYVGRTRPQLSIRCEPIDDYEFENVRFIKIDVEGWEMSVVEGCENTILRCDPVVQIEIKPLMLKRNNTNPMAIWQWFSQRGYQARHFAGDVTQPTLEGDKIKFTNIKENLVDFWFVKEIKDGF